jgi:cytochrome c-type biogenesis protein CcmH
MQFWFWIALLTLAALCFVIVPLLRKSAGKEIVTDAQRAENLRLFGEREAEIDADLAAGIIDSDGHGALIRELQLSLLDDVELGEGAKSSDFDSSGARPPWLLLAVVAVILPALAVSLYQRWGYIEDVELMSLFQRTLEAQGDPSQAQALVVDLGEVVKEDSERPWAWYFLGENFASLGMFNEAQIAYLQAAERLQGAPEESLVLGRAALALYIKSEFEFSPELDALVARAREINPGEIAVLQLLAADAQNREDYAAAIGFGVSLFRTIPIPSRRSRCALRSPTHSDFWRNLRGSSPLAPPSEFAWSLAKALTPILHGECLLPRAMQIKKACRPWLRWIYGSRICPRR